MTPQMQQMTTAMVLTPAMAMEMTARMGAFWATQMNATMRPFADAPKPAALPAPAEAAPLDPAELYEDGLNAADAAEMRDAPDAPVDLRPVAGRMTAADDLADAPQPDFAAHMVQDVTRLVDEATDGRLDQRIPEGVRKGLAAE
ncbi:MAG: hypothetical protein AAF390_19290 [Pseudomonadota bacterium]